MEFDDVVKYCGITGDVVFIIKPAVSDIFCVVKC